MKKEAPEKRAITKKRSIWRRAQALALEQWFKKVAEHTERKAANLKFKEDAQRCRMAEQTEEAKTLERMYADSKNI